MSDEKLRLVKGTIFDIQHYCIHDGPGIRTNVFVKGCPLRCLWCANPESQSVSAQLMYRRNKCTGCLSCVSACPVDAITVSFKDMVSANNGRWVVTDRSRCTACGKCIDVCTMDARELSGRIVSVGEVFDEVSEDMVFYGEEGGITMTGGEPLSQPEFSAALLKLCREAGITTAIETSGFGQWDTIKPVLSLCDTVLYDCKQMNTDLHQRFTGQKNERILDNLQKINNELSCNIVVRIPVIPGYNADEKNIRKVSEFVHSKISRCRQIDLLPFHNLGESKAEQLGKNPGEFRSFAPSEAEMENLRSIIRSFGFICK